MNDILKIKKMIIYRTLIVSTVLIIIFLSINKVDVAFGIILGVFISILNFNLLEYNIRKVVNLEPKKAKIRGVINYIFRYFLYGLALVVAVIYKEINIISTILSIYLMKLIIIYVGSKLQKNS